jgi:hypothetical protein
MTEITIPLEELQNGAAEPETSILPAESETLPRVDVARGMFITSRGEEIELSNKPISQLMLERLQSQGKPRIPMVEVTLMGKQKQLEPHPGHEGYLARLEEWKTESQLATFRYIFTLGTKGSPPDEFVEDQRTFFPTATDMEMKYLWIASRLPDEDIPLFTEAVLGQTIATAAGLQESADSFRSKG